MSFETTVGILGAIIIAVLQYPQVKKIHREKSADDLSWGTIGLHVAASIIWFTYGVVINKFPVILSNVFYGIANVAIVYMKKKYSNNITATV